jgi:hypothetical protein
MAAEVNDAAASFWQQIGTFAGIGAMVLAAALRAYRGGKGEQEPSHGHVVLEQAEIADLNVFRQLVLRYDAVLAANTNVDELRRMQVEMLDILKRMDRQEEIRSILREQRRRDDESK